MQVFAGDQPGDGGLAGPWRPPENERGQRTARQHQGQRALRAEDMVLANDIGGLSGPAIKPLALRMVWEVARALPSLPIIGIGGISDADDALEFLLSRQGLVDPCRAPLRHVADIHVAEEDDPVLFGE